MRQVSGAEKAMGFTIVDGSVNLGVETCMQVRPHVRLRQDDGDGHIYHLLVVRSCLRIFLWMRLSNIYEPMTNFRNIDRALRKLQRIRLMPYSNNSKRVDDIRHNSA